MPSPSLSASRKAASAAVASGSDTSRSASGRLASRCTCRLATAARSSVKPATSESPKHHEPHHTSEEPATKQQVARPAETVSPGASRNRAADGLPKRQPSHSMSSVAIEAGSASTSATTAADQ
eukprot:1367316-Prymnesium_polylepis.3